MKTSSSSRPGALSALILVAAGACVGPPGPIASDDMGTVSASLMLSPTASLDTADYSISGPNMFARSGSIDVRNSQTISVTVGGIPAGSGYNVAITGTSTDSQISCMGSATFAITPKMTTVVMIKIQCREPPKTGTVVIGGTVNICPLIDAIGANPGEVMVGFSRALDSAAHDSDGKPAALTYSWATTSGTLAGATTPNPTLFCTTAGVSTVTLTVSDGDCTDTGSVNIVCSPTPVRINEVESNGGTPGDWVELINTSSAAVDIGGWLFRDNDAARVTAPAVIPAGTILPPGGYYVLNEVVGGVGQFAFGLGGADSAMISSPADVLIDSFSWTAHATVTYGRCPNGTGAFGQTSSTKGTANDCSSGAGGSGGGAAGASGAAGAGGTTGAGGAAGAAGTTGAGGAAGAGGSAPSTVRINEVESNGGTPGDWVELVNVGASTADISGWLFRDNDPARVSAPAVIPAGTLLPPGGYYVLNEVVAGVGQFTFGLGAADSAILSDATDTPVDSYSWTAHATVTYGRCPNGTGAFGQTSSTKGAANDCSGGTGAGGAAGTTGAGGAAGGGAGMGGSAAGSGGAGGVAALPWPTDDTVVTVDELNQFPSNLSGLFYEPATATDPAILWAVQNSPSLLHRPVFNGTSWVGTATDGWTAGKTMVYTTGTGGPDSEGVTRAELGSSAIYVATERDNTNNGVSRLAILRFDTAASGTTLTATHDWNITADIPAVGANLGLEAITWIPDTYLVGNGFIDDTTLAAYDPSRYPGHGTGLFFVGVEATGSIYGYALDHTAGGFQRVATLSSGQAGVMDLTFDRDVGQLWAYCDNTCGNRSTILAVGMGHFQIRGFIDRAPTLTDANNEGIAIAPESECSGGKKSFFWADDGNTGQHALRHGTITCGPQF